MLNATLPREVGDQRSPADFMAQGFDLIGEPLNLREDGQRWFSRILKNEIGYRRGPSGLVFGATPWLTTLLAEVASRTVVADSSARMLDLCARALQRANSPGTVRRVDFLNCDWLSLPDDDEVRITAGDNSLSFLQFPDEWEQLLALIARRMTRNGVLITRFLSAPLTHRRLSAVEIVENALAQPRPVNFTAVRAALLFSQWNPKTFSIGTEAALNSFLQSRSEFDRLLDTVPNTRDNDLLTIAKYRGAGATYFAPPLSDAIAMFEKWFHVSAVQFGPYQMSQYFPVIVASRRTLLGECRHRNSS